MQFFETALRADFLCFVRAMPLLWPLVLFLSAGWISTSHNSFQATVFISHRHTVWAIGTASAAPPNVQPSLDTICGEQPREPTTSSCLS